MTFLEGLAFRKKYMVVGIVEGEKVCRVIFCRAKAMKSEPPAVIFENDANCENRAPEFSSTPHVGQFVTEVQFPLPKQGL